MGIESDQVVFEYLSRVGDMAQQQQLPSATRMRLVSELRNEIDRHRAKVSVDSPAAVRRILDRLGTPDDVVAAAGGDTGVPQPPPAAVPAQPAPRDPLPKEPRKQREPKDRGRGLRRAVPRPRSAEPEAPAGPHVPSPDHFAGPGHVAAPDDFAGPDDFGGGAFRTDWWRVDDSPFGADDSVPGFVGGVEIPDLLKAPPKKPQTADEAEGENEGKNEKKAGKKTAKGAARKAPKKEIEETGAGPAEASAAPEEVAAARRRRLPLPRPAAGWTNPLLLLAAAALVVGAALGNWFALILGWAVAYGSRRLTAAESKWAVLVLPGLSAAGGLVWLWGRNVGRWGTPIAQGHMNDALAETWPWVVRAAALASAAYLVWRSQRRR